MFSDDLRCLALRASSLQVLTMPSWLYRWPGSPPEAWRAPARAEGPFSARCAVPPEVAQMVNRRLFVSYSPNCQQFMAEGSWVRLLVAPTIERVEPREALIEKSWV